MKIRVDRDVLAEALAWVARAPPTRPVSRRCPASVWRPGPASPVLLRL